MLITRTSLLSGKVRTKEIPLSPDQLAALLNTRIPIQKICPTLSADDREFLVNGIVEEDWHMKYILGEHEGKEYIKCLTCSRTSFNLNDIKERYCSHCKKFHI